MREQFEKLPEIATSLSQHIYFGDDNLYHSDLTNFQRLVCWLNGAWYAYQEVKATRRPELDSDTCSDIRNHVSPLTKVIDR